MLISVLKGKLHRARVTDANVNYEGSLTLSQDLMAAAGFIPYERILVGNMGNGQRFETYIIKGSKNGGEVCLNGATAHLGKVGDLLTIMTFMLIDPKKAARHKPKTVTLNGNNKPVKG
jgi:aspartate 1-decarboxylase